MVSRIFQINSADPSLLGKLRDGYISPENDLYLVKKATELGHCWELGNIAQRTCSPVQEPTYLISGADLVELMRVVANCEKEIPLKFQGEEFQDLTKDSKFRDFTRLIPGMETELHQIMRKKIATKVLRAYENAKIIGKGLSEINKQGFPGRFIGQEQKKPLFLFLEVIFRDRPIVAAEVVIICNNWLKDEETDLSVLEWEESKRKEWDRTSKELDFLPWLVQKTWNSLEKNAWQKAHPGHEFDESHFVIWKKDQIDKEITEPTWFLKKCFGKESDADFANWREDVIKIRKQLWGKFKQDTGLDISFENYQRLSFEHYLSGSIESEKLWILRENYKNLESTDRDKFTDITDYVNKLKWGQEIKEGIASLTFKDWEKSQNDLLMRRYEGSNLPVDFKEYKAMQYAGFFNGPAPFILLDEKGRVIFKTTCEKGKLVRNKSPFDTSHDQTDGSGSGYAIFVIGSDQSLYAGSHIRDIFHHSSFLGAGAVMAAGEIKTNSDGTIIELSNKSGHYLPTDEENLFMLNYFRDKGVDLSQTKFTAFYANGTTKEYNAQDYLSKLEKEKPSSYSI